MFELLRIAVRVAAAATLACVGTLLLATLVQVLVGWDSQVVLTGSMAPGLIPGDLVISAPIPAEQLRPGQVIVVENPARPGTLLVHRLLRRNADGTLVTKGAANPTEDTAAVPTANVRGLARLRVPNGGAAGAVAAAAALDTGPGRVRRAGRPGLPGQGADQDGAARVRPAPGRAASAGRAHRPATQPTRPAPRYSFRPPAPDRSGQSRRSGRSRRCQTVSGRRGTTWWHAH